MKIKKTGKSKLKEDKIINVSIDGETSPTNDAFSASLNLLEDLKSEIEERKIIEEQLREREATLSLIFGNINEIVYSTKLTSPNSPHGIIQFISNRCVDILGIPSENFLSKNDLWFNLIHPDDIDSYNQQMAAIFATKKTATLQFRMLNKNTNTYLWMEDLIVPELDKKGKIIGTFGVARDVTKRKITDLLLIQKEEDYRKLFEDHSAVKLIIDPENGNIHDANYAAAQYYGWSREELKSMTIFQINGNDDFEVSNERLQKSKQLKRFHYELQHKKSSGEIREIEAYGNNITLSGKMFLHVIIIDITERKHAEKLLIESEKKYRNDFLFLRSILESPIGIVIFALDLKFCYTAFTISHKETIKKIWGVDIQVGMNMLDIISNTIDQEKAKTNFKRAFSNESFIVIEEYGDQKLNRFFYENYYSPIKNNENEIVGVSVFVINISERVNTEIALRQSEQSLSQGELIAKFGNWKLDLKNNTIQASEGAKNIYRTTKNVLTLTDLRNYNLPGYTEILDNALDDLVQNKKPYDVSFKIKRESDGEIIDVRSIAEYDAVNKILFGVVQDITEQTTALKLVHESEERYKLVLNTMNEGLMTVDNNDVVQFVNERMLQITGYNRQELIGNIAHQVLAPIKSYNLIIEKNKLRQKHVSDTYELQVKKKDGSMIWLSVSASPISDENGKVIGSIGVHSDITDIKHSNMELIRLNRLYQFTSQVNNIIIQTNSFKNLFQDICDIAIEYGKFHMGWIGLFNENSHVVEPISFAGFENGYLLKVGIITLNDSNKGKGPSGRAAATGKTFFSNDIENDENMLPWRKEALERNYRSCIALPIIVREKVFGIFAMYSAEINSFTSTEEVELLEKITQNVATSVEIILTNKEKEIAELQLKDSEDKFSKIFYLNPTAAGLSDVETGKYVEVNAAFCKLLGYTVEETIGKTAAELNIWSDSTRNKILQLINDESKATNIEVDLRSKDGSIKHALLSSENIISNKKKYRYTVANDITERILHEEELSKLSQAVEQSPVLIMITNIKGNIEYINKTFTDVTGYTLNEVLGKNPRVLNSGATSKEEYQKMWLTILSGKQWRGEFHNKKKNGELYWESAMLSPIFDHNGIIKNFLAIKSDITQLKLDESYRLKITDDLVQRNKDLEQFTYIVSHNLRSPVANIIGFNNLLTEFELDEIEKKDILDGINVSVLKLDEVIKDLNTILQVRQSINEKKETVYFNEILKDVKDSLGFNSLSNSVSIQTHFDITETNTLKSYMNSIFYNFISNSIKYKKPDVNSLIEITTLKTDNGFKLIFKDNGMGIDMQKDGDKIFALYKRFHTTFAEGKGVGLYMVKSQVEALGGTIQVDSEVNKGTTFTLEFNN